MTPGYYIYYRIAADQLERARSLVGAVQHDVLAATGVQGRLLRRRDDPSTWMEVYDDVGDEAGFERALAAAVARHEFAAVIAAGSRRVAEVFAPI